MDDFLSALGLVLVIEGIGYALVPDAVKRLAAAALEMPAEQLRTLGLGAAILGVLSIWLVRG